VNREKKKNLRVFGLRRPRSDRKKQKRGVPGLRNPKQLQRYPQKHSDIGQGLGRYCLMEKWDAQLKLGYRLIVTQKILQKKG